MKIKQKSLGVILVFDRIKEPTPPPYGRLTVDDLQKHAVDIDFFLKFASDNITHNRIYVRSVSDLSGDLDSSKEYFIDGIIDMGDTQIKVPSTGLKIRGYGYNNSGLYSTANNYTMFYSDTVSGDVVFEELFLNASGTGSKIFDLTNNGSGAIELINLNLGQFGYSATNALGSISSYRQFRMTGCAVILALDGFTFNGTMLGNITITDSIGLVLPASHTLLKEGTSLSIVNGINSNMNFNSVNSATEFCDFQASNIVRDSSFQLSKFRTTATNAIPNIPSSNVKARFENCLGVKNTYIGGEWTLTTESATTITTAGTYVKANGTTTYSNLQHFTNTTSNAFLYEADETIDVSIIAIVGISGTVGTEARIQLRQWDNSASSYIILSTSPSQALNAGVASNRAENVTIASFATIDINDRIELWITNISTIMSVTVLNNSKCIICER